jgi:Protein of unknown function (DUF429)
MVHASRHIWLAEAIEPDHLIRLECGRDRLQMTDHLAKTPYDSVIGLDFAFSFPAWYLALLGVCSGPQLWRHVTACGEAWITACEPPFWGRPGRPRPAMEKPEFRRTELAVPRISGVTPKSIFQIGGAGSVGTGSLRGMPLLHTLHTGGAAIWPFSHAGVPTLVEIYPRLMTGPVRKSNAGARARLLERYPLLAAEHRSMAIASEDAFDAAVSALVMIEHVADLVSLSADQNLEGRIWHPTWREDRL